MSSYLTEDEQVEALKKWWKENGKSVISGIVLGFALIFGWQGWERYQSTQGEQASILFSNMETQLTVGNDAQGVELAKRLIVEHGDSVYATFASLQLAKISYDKGEKPAAQSHLQWAMDNAPDESLSGLARLRLAHLLFDMDRWEASQALVDAAGDVLPGEFAQLRGDLAVQKGELAAARTAYREALDAGVENAELVRMKLVDIGQGASS